MSQPPAAWKYPLAHHLAESRNEIELLRDGTGRFVPLLEELSAWDPEAIPRGSRPLDYLRMASKAHRALIVHGNYLDDEEIAFLAKHAQTMTVVYCPRTHDYFRHDPYPLAKMVSAGVNVALGTDSRASNPDLSILAEMRFAATRHPLVSPARLLRMITADAAQAIGRDQEMGTITPGKFADLAILAVPKYDGGDLHEVLLDPATHVVATVFRGRAVFGEQMLIGANAYRRQLEIWVSRIAEAPMASSFSMMPMTSPRRTITLTAHMSGSSSELIVGEL